MPHQFPRWNNADSSTPMTRAVVIAEQLWLRVPVGAGLSFSISHLSGVSSEQVPRGGETLQAFNVKLGAKQT